MHIAAAGWTMTTLTESPTLVGLVQTAWAVPGFLLALHAGAFADMVDRRRLIAITQIVALFIAGALAMMQWTDHLSVNWLLAGTFLESVALTISALASGDRSGFGFAQHRPISWACIGWSIDCSF